MQCVAILPSGKQCSRPAAASSQACSLHRAAAGPRPAPAFYAEQLSQRERKLLAEAAQLEGVDAEVAVLRLLIREMASDRDLEAARRGIEALGRILRNRHAMTDSASQLTSWLDSVLADMAEEALAKVANETPEDG